MLTITFNSKMFYNLNIKKRDTINQKEKSNYQFIQNFQKKENNILTKLIYAVFAILTFLKKCGISHFNTHSILKHQAVLKDEKCGISRPKNSVELS